MFLSPPLFLTIIMPPRGRSVAPKTPAPLQSQANVSTSSRTRSMSRARVKALTGSLSARSLSRVRVSAAASSASQNDVMSAPSIGLVRKGTSTTEKAPYGSGGAKYFSSSQVLTAEGVFVQPDNLTDQFTTENMSKLYAFQGTEDSDANNSSDLDSDEAKAVRASKSKKQWTVWTHNIIPQLLQPYMILMQETASLRNVDNIKETNRCMGCEKGRQISIQCIFFNSKFSVYVMYELYSVQIFRN